MSAPTTTSPLQMIAARPAAVRTVLQVSATLLLSLVAGSTFGLWRGLGAADFSAATFIDVHQALVGGLNVLLPVMGAAAALLIATLAWRARGTRRVLRFYLTALALSVAAALVTRLWNQPINAQVMSWTPDAIPANWMDIRASWWHAHVIRTILSIAATVNLLLAILADRGEPA